MKTYINPFLLFLYSSILIFGSCKNTQTTNNIPVNEKKASEYTSCQLVEKEFVNKGGKITEYKELYLRCSIQDYFIKICEGKITLKELEKYIDKGITVEMEIKDGMWDHCSDDPAYAQSRMGTYVVIHKIIE